MKTFSLLTLLMVSLFVGCISLDDERYDRNEDRTEDRYKRPRYDDRTESRDAYRRNGGEIRNHRNFDGVDFDASGDVYLTQGERYEVRVEGDGESVRRLQSEVRGNVLKLYFRGMNWNWDSRRNRLKVYITSPNLRFLSIGGSGSMKLNRLETNHLHLDISGSGNMDLQNIQTRTFKTDISGSGRINVSGNADRGNVEVSGSGSFEATQFQMRDANIEISGSGRMKVYAVSNLDAEISGSGEIAYRGNPRIRKDVSGSGSIRRM